MFRIEELYDTICAVEPRNKDIFLSGLRKLVKAQQEPDLLLKGGDSEDGAAIYAYKSFMAGGSSVFKKMLLEADAKLETTITLSEMKHEEVEALVEFMQSLDGSITSETLKKHARSLYIAADKYEIPHLRDISRNELISSLNSSNALSILEFAQAPFDKPLNDAALTTIRRNIRVIASSDELRLFVVKYPNLAVEIMKANTYGCY